MAPHTATAQPQQHPTLLASTLALLEQRVRLRTESQAKDNRACMEDYLRLVSEQLTPLGFTCTVVENPVSPAHPALIARRIESSEAPTVLLYGHGDVQFAHPDAWSPGLDPWALTRCDDRLYGRGTADNKGQHTVNLVALEAVIRQQASEQTCPAADAVLGYNVTVLLETGEEVGSTGLHEIAEAHRESLQADLFIGSDGPRLSAEAPTLFLGSRGSLNIRLECRPRDGAHHSGNWGGKLRNPATVIAAAIAALVDGNGIIQPDALRPPPMSEAVRTAIASLPRTAPAQTDPSVDETWGEPGLTPDERTFGFNALEVLTLHAGTPEAPVNAIPGSASALIQLRFVVGTEPEDIVPAVRDALNAAGIHSVDVISEGGMPATRLDPDHQAVRAAADAIERATGRTAAILPNLGGTIPNAVFSRTLGLPTIWIPHSYPGCNQHAPDEHALASILAEGCSIMVEVFADISAHPERWF